MQYLSPDGQKVVDVRTGTSSQNIQGPIAVGDSLVGINPVPMAFKDPFNTAVIPTGIDAFGVTLMGTLPVDPGLNFIDISPSGEYYALVAATANSVATARYITVNASGEVACQLPTGAATSANQSTEITSLQLIDDVPTASGAVFSKGVPIMGVKDDTATTSASEDRAEVVRITRLRGLHVNPRDDTGVELFLTPALIADGVSKPTISKINAFPSVFNGSTTDMQRGDVLGTWVQGGIAHDSPNSTLKPVKIGGRARTSHITGVANDDIADLIANVLGFAGVTLAHNDREDTFTGVAAGTTLGDGFQNWKYYTLSVRETGTVTSWTVVLQFSLDGLTFTTFLTHTKAGTGSGVAVFSADAIPRPAKYIREEIPLKVGGVFTITQAPEVV